MKKNVKLMALVLIVLLLVACSAQILEAPENELEVQRIDTTELVDINLATPSFDQAIKTIFENRQLAIDKKDYDLYMSSITRENPYFFNEQERWFMGMTDEHIKGVSFEILKTELLDENSAVVTIAQVHTMDKEYRFDYPLLFKYEFGQWMDYGYNFEVFETDRFKVKYMPGETKVNDFVIMLSDAYEHLDVLYDEKPHTFFEMKLFNDQEMLRQRTVPSNAWLFTGWSEPDESLKLFTGQGDDYKGYPGVVQHELVHHITIRMCNNNLAVWMLEGIAMYDGSAYYGFNTSSLLSQMTKKGVSMTIEELEAIDLGSDISYTQIVNFYDTGYMYIRYLVETYGRETVMNIFKEAGKKPFHDSTLNKSFEENNQKTTAEVLIKVIGLSKEAISTDYLEWLDTVEGIW
jgi:hypothetical protein